MVARYLETPMHEHTKLAYTFPTEDIACGFAEQLRGSAASTAGSLRDLLLETCSELRGIKVNKRVVRAVHAIDRDSYIHAEESRSGGATSKRVEAELWEAFEALVKEYGGSPWRPGFEAIEASAPAVAALRNEGVSAFAVLEAPPLFLESMGELWIKNTYGDQVPYMALLDCPSDLKLSGRWRLMREGQEVGTWSGVLGKSTLAFNVSGQPPEWKPGDLVVLETPVPQPKPGGLLGHLKGLLGSQS